MKDIFRFFSSLKLTVVLLSLSMALIFFGTLAQVETGIWKTQKDYFESLLVVWRYPEAWIAYEQLFWLRVPMPGGYLLGGLLLVNLIFAHITRFKFTLKKSGIFLVHFGLILLLISELLTDLVSVESQMSVDEGGQSNYSESFQENELVFIDRSHPELDRVHSVPVQLLKPGVRIKVPDSPLEISTVHFYPNAKILIAQKGSLYESPANMGAAADMRLFAVPEKEVYADDKTNIPTAYIEVFGPDGPLGTWLFFYQFKPQMVRLGEQTWEVTLRPKRHYHPFSVELIDFSHDKYPGTETPYNFSSEVVIRHSNNIKNQKALIYMNHPLRYEGLTFYQASFANNDRTSIFQVVRNPGWILPYISVLLMGLGMVVQFGMHFFKFLDRQGRKNIER